MGGGATQKGTHFSKFPAGQYEMKFPTITWSHGQVGFHAFHIHFQGRPTCDQVVRLNTTGCAKINYALLKGHNKS